MSRWDELVQIAEDMGAAWVDERALDDGLHGLTTTDGIILVSTRAKDRCFTLAHEIGHLYYRWNYGHHREHGWELEAACDAFAQRLSEGGV